MNFYRKTTFFTKIPTGYFSTIRNIIPIIYHENPIFNISCRKIFTILVLLVICKKYSFLKVYISPIMWGKLKPKGLYTLWTTIYLLVYLDFYETASQVSAKSRLGTGIIIQHIVLNNCLFKQKKTFIFFWIFIMHISNKNKNLLAHLFVFVIE